MESAPAIGVVAIGRNEGDRLRRCLDSMGQAENRVVYVDSGSTDASVELARSRGVAVVELDSSAPFSAARARNAGFEHLLRLHPELTAVQFVDADCALLAAWLDKAHRVLQANPDVGAVCGRRSELHPEASSFNRLCELEWNFDSPGEVSVFGGDVMMRVDSFREVSGYDPRIVAGEDPELSIRLRQSGWRILRLDEDMTVHDADITTLGQWWRRAFRCGHAFAQVSALHGPASPFMRDKRRAYLWGLVLPLLCVGLLWATDGLSLLLLLLYPMRFLWVTWNAWKRDWSSSDALLWAAACVGSSFPHLLGISRFYLDRSRNSDPTLIEYKRPAQAPRRAPSGYREPFP